MRFCPQSDVDKFEIIKDLQLFSSKLLLKSKYIKIDPTSKEKEQTQHERDVETLVELSEDQDGIDLIDKIDLESLLVIDTPTKIDKIPKIQSLLKKKSDKFPALGSNINLGAFLSMTAREINKRNFHPNVLFIMTKGGKKCPQ